MADPLDSARRNVAALGNGDYLREKAAFLAGASRSPAAEALARLSPEQYEAAKAAFLAACAAAGNDSTL